MTLKITCIIKDVNRNNPCDWSLDLPFKIESDLSNSKGMTLAGWMGALLMNVSDEYLQDILRQDGDFHWDRIVY